MTKILSGYKKIKNIIVDVYRQNRYLNEQECFTENEHRQI